MNDDDYRVGYKCPPRHSQFPPGTSGNLRGRPRKARRALVPSQTRKDILEIADEMVTIPTQNGVKKLTKSQLIKLAIANGAAKGNPTCIREWGKMENEALQQRLEAYPSVRLIELLLQIVEDPRFDPPQLEKEALDQLLRATKRFY
jgi:hypothetical protein